MTVSSVTPPPPPRPRPPALQRASTTAASATLNYNQFLQLLMTEMKNQDPTQPMDPTQQLSQLASFSAVEQQVQTNTTLTSLFNTSAIVAGGIRGRAQGRPRRRLGQRDDLLGHHHFERLDRDPDQRTNTHARQRRHHFVIAPVRLRPKIRP